jgi:D-aminopeptidase
MKNKRARELGIPFDGQPGPLNAITDVRGVAVGHTTLNWGEGRLEIGKGPVRTGVTAVFPRLDGNDPVLAAWYSLNGCGEMTGALWIEESGFLEGPLMITNTLSVSAVREAVTLWMISRYGMLFALPVVAETYDGFLNDIKGSHVKQEHALEAIRNASGGPVAEGNVGGGTGMICHGFKGGIGSASRLLPIEAGGYTVGVLVQANHGRRENLRIGGVPVGADLKELQPNIQEDRPNGKVSSIIVVVATDCPLLPTQCKRLAQRVPLGIARVGGMGGNFSGDIFLAFSTASLGKEQEHGIRTVAMYPNEGMDALFEATVQATEEAITNCLVAAETMVGINSNTVYGLPHERIQEVLRKYNRLTAV